MQEVRWNILDEIMLYDMYLRENVKGRPVWAKDTAKYKKEWKMLYREQGEKLFPEDVQAGIYDSKRAANQSHIEVFEINIKIIHMKDASQNALVAARLLNPESSFEFVERNDCKGIFL